MPSESGRELETHDIVVAVIIALAAGVVVWLGYRELAPQILDYRTFDYWFDSDAPAVAESMLNRYSAEHWRTSHHPLFPLMTLPWTATARILLHTSRADAVGLVLAATAAFWAGGFFVVLRQAAVRRLDAAIFTTLACLTAASVFWFATPETVGLSAAALLPALGLVAVRSAGRRPPLWACILAAALTLSVTTTDWMVGLLMLVFVLPLRKAVAAGVASFGLVVLLWYVQRLLVPNAVFFVQLGNLESYVFNPLSKGPVAEVIAFFLHSVVVPLPEEAYGSRLSVEGLLPGTGGTLALAGVLLWGGLLVAAGVMVVWNGFGRMTAFLLLAISGQLALHLVFGIEIFLYSAHFVPLLVAFAATATRLSTRPIVTGLTLVLVVAAGFNNLGRFLSSSAQLRHEYQHQHDFEVRMAELTPADAILIFGLGAAAGEGSTRARPPSQDPPSTITFETMMPGVTVERAAWMVSYDIWSIDLFEQFRERGAHYFVTAYARGIEQNRELWTAMDQRYELVERTSTWILYRLVPDR